MIEYRVVERDGCTLIYGALPADDFALFAKKVGRGGVADANLARMAGADFAFGQADACAGLKAVFSANAETAASREYPTLQSSAARWLGSGERGASADAIFYQLTGVETGSKTAHPFDPADLRRCRLLLERVSSLQTRFKGVMAGVSVEWAHLIQIWDTLCETMDREAPEWREPNARTRCPETLTLMRNAESAKTR